MKSRNLSDWIVAGVVVICSAVLFGALALALSGTMLGRPDRTILANFSDVTGISLGAQVRVAGAPAGRVLAIRMLTLQERAASPNSRNAVQVTIGLNRGVPPLPSDITASVAADTLLSDKFLLLDGGTPGAPALANNAVLQGITPISFDRLARNLDHTVEGLNGILGGGLNGAGDAFDSLRGILTDTRSLLTETRTLITGAGPIVQDVQSLITEARSAVTDARTTINGADQLLSTNRERVSQAIARLDRAAEAFERLATRGESLVANNERKLADTLADFKVTAENLKITSTYTRILSRNLTLRPSQLIWGGRPPALPGETDILRDNQPAP